MTGTALAALVASVIVSYQDVKAKTMPPPYRFTGVLLVFGGISLLAGRYPPLASALSWGFVIAIAVNGTARDLLARTASDTGSSSTSTSKSSKNTSTSGSTTTSTTSGKVGK